MRSSIFAGGDELWYIEKNRYSWTEELSVRSVVEKIGKEQFLLPKVILKHTGDNSPHEYTPNNHMQEWRKTVQINVKVFQVISLQTSRKGQRKIYTAFVEVFFAFLVIITREIKLTAKTAMLTSCENVKSPQIFSLYRLSALRFSEKNL